MSYCVVQTDPTEPTLDQIKQAFRGLKGYTEADAIKLGRENTGIFKKGLTLDVARSMQQALTSQGVAVQAVEESDLPRLPDAKFIRRAELQAGQFIVYDPLDRPLPIGLEHLQMIAVGPVCHFELNSFETQEVRMEYNLVSGYHPALVTEKRHQVQTQAQFIIDLLWARASLRFQIEADHFQYKPLFDRPELQLPGKVSLLVQILVQHAPRAILNRGATQMRDQALEVRGYSSKTALFDEERWLLWRQQKQP